METKELKFILEELHFSSTFPSAVLAGFVLEEVDGHDHPRHRADVALVADRMQTIRMVGEDERAITALHPLEPRQKLLGSVDLAGGAESDRRRTG